MPVFEYGGKNLARVDCAIIITGHGNVDYQMLVENCPLIFDARNTLKGIESGNIVRL